MNPSQTSRPTPFFLTIAQHHIQPREIVAEFADTREEPPASHEAIFEEFKGTGDMEVHLAIPETETVETTGQTHTATSEEADFDQRLLDDLIKDYGEFTILPSSTSKLKPRKSQDSNLQRLRRKLTHPRQ